MSSYAEWFGGRRLSLLRFAATLCDDQQTAQDVVQEVALRAHRRWDELQAIDHPDAYLRRMVVNEYLSWRRKWARIIPWGELTDLQVGAAVDHAGQIADRQQLRRELATLPRKQRAVLVLRYYEGLDDASIAEMLGTKPVTVRAYASRALARLRVDMAEPRPPGIEPPPASKSEPSSHPTASKENLHAY